MQTELPPKPATNDIMTVWLPGAAAVVVLVALHLFGRGILLVDAALFGVTAALPVIAANILFQAGQRALTSKLRTGLAVAAFAASLFLALPFPLILGAAAFIGFAAARNHPARLGMPANDNVMAPQAGRWRLPFVDTLQGKPKLAGAFAGLIAAAIGIAAHLLVWFALQVVFGTVTEMHAGWLRWYAFDPNAIEKNVVILGATAALLTFRFRRSLIEVIVVMALLGMITRGI